MRRASPRRADRAVCLNVALRLGEFSQFQLSADTGTKMDQLKRIIDEWEAEGLVEFAGRQGPKSRHHWRVTDKARALKSGVAVTPEQTPEQNMWSVARFSTYFTPVDLTSYSIPGSGEITLTAARKWCRTMLEAGYLRAEERAVPGRREATYRLINNTGPLAPIVRRVTVVYDGNSRAPTYVPEVTT